MLGSSRSPWSRRFANTLIIPGPLNPFSTSIWQSLPSFDIADVNQEQKWTRWVYPWQNIKQNTQSETFCEFNDTTTNETLFGVMNIGIGVASVSHGFDWEKYGVEHVYRPLSCESCIKLQLFNEWRRDYFTGNLVTEF